MARPLLLLLLLLLSSFVSTVAAELRTPTPGTQIGVCNIHYSNAKCDTIAGCEYIRPLVCSGTPQVCKYVHYGCFDKGTFCSFNRPPFSDDLYKIQCSMYSSYCAWVDDACIYAPLGVRETNIPTGLPTQRPSSEAPPITLAPSPNLSQAPFLSSYSIETRYTPGSLEALPTISKQIQESVQLAAQRWETIITNDINSTYLLKADTSCFVDSTMLNHDVVVDDLLVFVDILPIDGVSGLLGRSGPCIVSSTGGTYSRVGLMQLDSADIPILYASGSLDSMVLHEMAHVIGFGTLWSSFNLVTLGTVAPLYYLGEGGLQGQEAVGGIGQPIVENKGGPGTYRVHFDEAVYDNELMTGWLDPDSKLSKITIGSLQDLGFSVNMDNADPYVIPAPKKPRYLRGTPLEYETVYVSAAKTTSKTTGHSLDGDVFEQEPMIVEATPYL